MLATYASLLILLGCSVLVGQAVLGACGRRRWSRLAPAVGFAGLLALAWGTVRLPGEGLAAAIAVGLVTLIAALYLRGRAEGVAEALRGSAPLELVAVLLASIPFFVEMRYGILGTGLNPDMSQHLFAADRLASGASERLISEGYPLGPHALVVALAELGPSTVHAFDGLAIAVAVITCITALGALEAARVSTARGAGGALLVGFAYLLAANFVQGAFKESIEALFVLAFAVCLGELAREWPRRSPAPRLLRAVPLAVLAIGAAYAYSFPGLLWLAGTLGAWAAIELWRAARRGTVRQAARLARLVAPSALVAAGVLLAAIAPELPRMASFADFETFDPAGAGLGNLFNRLSPLEALGVWPSGDFRVEPGDGAVPAIVFYLGSALALAAFAYGVRWWARRGERWLLAALCAAIVLWLYGLIAGTPYQEAKALVILAPLVMLVSVGGILATAPDLVEARGILERRSLSLLFPGRARLAKERLVVGAIGVVFLAAAAGSSLLALANGPVGPAGYSPQLAELRTRLPAGSVLVLAPRDVLADQHGRDYLVWELRGNRICVAESGTPPEPGIGTELLVSVDGDGAVVPEGTYTNRGAKGPGPCPLVSETGRADPSGDG